MCTVHSLSTYIHTYIIYRKLRKRDVSKFHIQLSIALFCMLIVFVTGIDQTQVYGGCVTVSALLQYFTLVMWMWMAAEAVFMFQKLVIVFIQVTTRYIIAVSLVCWCKFLSILGITTVTTSKPLVVLCTSLSLQWYQLFQWSFHWQLTETSWSHFHHQLSTEPMTLTMLLTCTQ